MKTSFEEIMTRDFEKFLAEDMDGLGSLDFKVLGAILGGRKSVWRDFWRHAAETAAGFNLVDYLVFSSPAVAVVAIIFIGKPLIKRILQGLPGM